MPIDVLQLAGNLTVAAAGAWIGSKLGVRHALEKLRNEKAFERRLTWYEDTAQAAAAARDTCVAYAVATRYDTSQLEALAARMNIVFQTFGEKAGKAALYAPNSTVQRIDELVKEMLQLAVETCKTLERGQLYEEFAKNVDSLALSLTRFVFELAQELREELALDKIELSDVQKTALGMHS